MDICLILNAPPWDIGILSSSKGLIAGSIKLTLKDDTVLDVESVDGGTRWKWTEKIFLISDASLPFPGILLPQQTVSIKKVETSARFVLLVEKHTVYEKCLLENVLNRLGPCILITVCMGMSHSISHHHKILPCCWTGKGLSWHQHTINIEEDLGRLQVSDLRSSRRWSFWYRNNVILSTRHAGMSTQL